MFNVKSSSGTEQTFLLFQAHLQCNSENHLLGKCPRPAPEAPSQDHSEASVYPEIQIIDSD